MPQGSSTSLVVWHVEEISYTRHRGSAGARMDASTLLTRPERASGRRLLVPERPGVESSGLDELVSTSPATIGTFRSSRGPVCLAPPRSSDPNGGPRHRLVSELAAWLHSQGWPVEIVAANDRSSTLASPRGQSPQVIGMGFRLRRLSPWLVHAFETRDAVASQVASAPYVMTVEHVPGGEAFGFKPASLLEFRNALSGAQRLVSTSRMAAERLSETYGYQSVVVPDGVDSAALGGVPSRRTRPVVVCPTSGARERDLQLVVDAFVRAASVVPDLQMATVGPIGAAAHARLVERIPARMRGSLLVIENTSHRKLLGLFARASVTCFPSTMESFDRTVIESLGVGTAVVCADGGVAAELIDEDAVASNAGLRFAPGEVEACASALLTAIDRSFDEEVVAGCRRLSSLYDWDLVGPRLVEVYRLAGA